MSHLYSAGLCDLQNFVDVGYIKSIEQDLRMENSVRIHPMLIFHVRNLFTEGMIKFSMNYLIIFSIEDEIRLYIYSQVARGVR